MSGHNRWSKIMRTQPNDLHPVSAALEKRFQVGARQLAWVMAWCTTSGRGPNEGGEGTQPPRK